MRPGGILIRIGILVLMTAVALLGYHYGGEAHIRRRIGQPPLAKATCFYCHFVSTARLLWAKPRPHHDSPAGLVVSHDGKKLLQTIGTYDTTTERNAIATGLNGRPSLTKKSGPANATFGRQTDIAWLPDGTFFVTDGYEETRVVKFDKDGKFLMAWGERGEAGGKETRPNNYRLPQLTYADDHPGEDLPAFHFAFEVTADETAGAER